MGGAVLPVLAVAGIYSAYESKEAQKDAAAAQKKAMAEQQRRSDIEAYRARIQQVREARTARGATLQTAQSLGVQGSSSAVGAVGSIQSQAGANISFLDTIQQSAKQQSIFQSQAIDAGTKAAEWGMYGDIVGSIFQQGFGGYKELFKQKSTP